MDKYKIGDTVVYDNTTWRIVDIVGCRVSLTYICGENLNDDICVNLSELD